MGGTVRSVNESRFAITSDIGFGMFGKRQRHEIYYVVAVTWTLQIIWSHLWLKFFRFGPPEWLWRSLTYWKKQPFRKETNSGSLVE